MKVVLISLVVLIYIQIITGGVVNHIYPINYIRVSTHRDNIDDNLFQIILNQVSNPKVIFNNKAISMEPIPMRILWVSRLNTNDAVCFVPAANMGQHVINFDNELRINRGGYFPSFTYLLPKIGFVLMVQSMEEVEISCHVCTLFPLSLFLMIIPPQSIDYGVIEKIPIHYYYSRQFQKFEIIEWDDFTLRDINQGKYVYNWISQDRCFPGILTSGIPTPGIPTQGTPTPGFTGFYLKFDRKNNFLTFIRPQLSHQSSIYFICANSGWPCFTPRIP